MAQTMERPVTQPPMQTLPPIILPDSAAMPRKQWTRAECKKLIECGLLEETGWELIEGEIIRKMGQGRRRIFVCMRIIKALAAVFGFDFLQSQSSLPVNDINEPEPDAVVLAETLEHYLDVEPGPEDVRLLVEVSDSTLRTDQTVKMRLYARGGVPEYWIVNIRELVLEVYRQPSPEGYTEKIIIGKDGSITPPAASQAQIKVGDLLP
ncbi:MAG: Uma2 family endonuclease [Armatimonadetes bacterium]|nr:Uma2 family endonuclease [Armatimonadota bacterium]